jgi:hypothetical protein
VLVRLILVEVRVLSSAPLSTESVVEPVRETCRPRSPGHGSPSLTTGPVLLWALGRTLSGAIGFDSGKKRHLIVQAALVRYEQRAVLIANDNATALALVA